MRNCAMVLVAMAGTCLCQPTTAQEPEVPTLYVEVQFMKVPEGGDDLYLQVEKVWQKIHAMRRQAGIVQQSVLCKVNRTEGPEPKYNYAVIHVFDSWDKLENPYPASLFEGELPFDEEERAIFDKTGSSRSMVTAELWKLADVADPAQLGSMDVDKTLVVSYMKSKNANRHRELEADVWKKIWAQATKDGYRANWLLCTRRFPGGQGGEYNAIAVHLFPKGEPKKAVTAEWWSDALPKIFPDKSAEDVRALVQETGQVRDMPITEEWEILQTLDSQ